MFNLIVVAIDGSEAGNKALDLACDLARKLGSDLHLVHSPQIETAMVAMGYMVVESVATPSQIVEAGTAVMEGARARAAELGCETVECTIGQGDPVEDILRTAELNEADLIVMGRRGLGSLASLVLGSVSQAVSKRAECSVLTVHA